MTVTFRTIVLDVPPSPLGLLPARIVIEHRCNLCHHEIATEDLGAHARRHDLDHNREVTAAD